MQYVPVGIIPVDPPFERKTGVTDAEYATGHYRCQPTEQDGLVFRLEQDQCQQEGQCAAQVSRRSHVAKYQTNLLNTNVARPIGAGSLNRHGVCTQLTSPRRRATKAASERLDTC